ncbi:MAG: hypothetical protein GOV15_03015, partial [Candidatus Diapherotrites archaeon]|nr:hypothetical protein [Candidatus Diapherotrites archaeon]
MVRRRKKKQGSSKEGVGVSKGVSPEFNGKILTLFDQTLGVIEKRVKALKSSGADVSSIADAAKILKPKRVDLEDALKSGDSETVSLIIDVLKKLALKAKAVQKVQSAKKDAVEKQKQSAGERSLAKVVASLEDKIRHLELEADGAEKERNALKAKLEATGGGDIQALMGRVNILSKSVKTVENAQIPALKKDLTAALNELRKAVSTVKG